MIAWRMPPPACLPVVDLSLPSSIPLCVSSGVAGSGEYSSTVPSWRFAASCLCSCSLSYLVGVAHILCGLL